RAFTRSSTSLKTMLGGNPADRRLATNSLSSCPLSCFHALAFVETLFVVAAVETCAGWTALTGIASFRMRRRNQIEPSTKLPTSDMMSAMTPGFIGGGLEGIGGIAFGFSCRAGALVLRSLGERGCAGLGGS